MSDLISTMLTTAAVIAALTQTLKEKLNLSGRLATVLALILGAAVGFATLQPAAATLLPGLPAVAGAVIMGLLSGVIASGGYKTLTGLQDRAAELRASAPAPQVTVQPQVQVTVPAPDPVPQAETGGFPADDPRAGGIQPLLPDLPDPAEPDYGSLRN